MPLKLPPELWQLGCGCVAYSAPTFTDPRQMRLAECTKSSLGLFQTAAAKARAAWHRRLRILPWPEHYVEGDELPRLGSRSDAPFADGPVPSGREAVPPGKVVWHDTKAFVVPVPKSTYTHSAHLPCTRTPPGEMRISVAFPQVTLTSQNLWHTLFGAVPTFEAYTTRLGAEDADLLPRYTRVGEPGSGQWGVGYGGWGRLSRVVTAAASEPVANWSTWQLLVLALRPLAGWEEAARRTEGVFYSGHYHCYARGLYGGHAAYYPTAKNRTALLAARRRLGAFRTVVLTNLGLLPKQTDARHPPAVAQGVFLLRRSSVYASRMIVNEEELVAALQALRDNDPPRIPPRIDLRLAHLEELPLTEQLRLVVGARLLAGVHGGGLAWGAFLPAGASLLEIYPDTMLKGPSQHARCTHSPAPRSMHRAAHNGSELRCHRIWCHL